MKTKKAIPYYKCRLCGHVFSEYEGTQLKYTDAMDRMIEITYDSRFNSEKYPPMVYPHECGYEITSVGEWPYRESKVWKEKRIGLADFIGYQEEYDPEDYENDNK